MFCVVLKVGKGLSKKINPSGFKYEIWRCRQSVLAAIS